MTIAKKASLGVTLGLGASIAATGMAQAASLSAGKWDRIAACESGDMNTTGSGHWNLSYGDADSTGGLQIQDRTWADFGGLHIAPHAYQATKDQQIAIAERILAAQGPTAWACNSPGHGIASGALNGRPLSPDTAQDQVTAPAQASEPKPDRTRQHESKAGTYTVQAGDSLTKIASRLGVHGGWRTLYVLNRSAIGADPGSISTGTKLEMPATGIPTPDSSTPSAKVLQYELKRTGYLSNGVAYTDNYGPKTQAAVRAFHRDHPQFSADRPEAIGDSGWAYLTGTPTS